MLEEKRPTSETGIPPEGTTAIGELKMIPRNRIRVFPSQPREYFDPDEMNDLAASIAEIGQKTPIWVMRVHGDPNHDYELIDGERRYLACGMVGVEMMLAWIRPIEDVEEQFEEALVANLGRADHTPLEIAHSIGRLQNSKNLRDLSHAEQVKSIAQRCARCIPWVYQHLAILRLAPEVQAMMSPEIPEKERLNFSFAIYLSSYHEKLQLEIAKEVLAKKMSLVRARLYAQQIAAGMGIKTKTARRPGGLPWKGRNRLENTLRIANENIDTLLVPEMQVALRKQTPQDIASLTQKIQRTIDRLKELQTVLTTKPEPVVVAMVTQTVTPKAPILEKVVAIKPIVAVKPVEKKLLPSPSPAPTPTPPKLNGKEPFWLSGRILRAMFYDLGAIRVNLSRKRLAGMLNVSNDRELYMLVNKALGLARSRWRVSPTGDNDEREFITLLSKIRQDLGDYPRFDDALKYAKRENKARDPISI